MKKVMVFAVLVVFLCPGLSQAGVWEAEITGYEPEQFAIVGPILNQVEVKIVEPIKQQRAEGQKGRLQITAIGYADKTGRKNDYYGRDRAEEMLRVLSTIFPDIKKEDLIAVTKGDVEDVKKVIVRWTFAEDVAAVNGATQGGEKKVKHEENIYFKLLAIILALVIVFFAAGTTIKRKRKAVRKLAKESEKIIKEPQPARSRIYLAMSEYQKRIAPTEVVFQGKDFECEASGKIFVIPLILMHDNAEGRIIVTPFMTLQDPTKPLFRKDMTGIKKDMKGCLKDGSKYQDQRDKLIGLELGKKQEPSVK
ncbi:MAG: hypothetical protein V1845_01815 [bacterium]